MIQVTPLTDYGSSPRDAGQEVPFDAKDLLYSRTDRRGVIESGNDVFEALSGYPMAEMIGAPHRIIRHPDTPRGFFHVFWQFLNAGEPAVGYVKNRSKDGRYYWVLAAAVPCEGGFFSVRLKPTTTLFNTIRGEYARLRRREEAEKLSPEDSAQLLLDRLRELGFHSYPEFMSQALQDETAARDAFLGRPADKVATHLFGLVSALSNALKEQTRLVGLFDSLKLLPVNMRLIAARLEPQGGPISQISMNYKTSFDNISERLSNFVTGEGNICGRMEAAISRSLVLTNCSRLYAEMAEHIRRPSGSYQGEENRQEHAFADRLGAEGHTRAASALTEAGRLAADLIAAAKADRVKVLVRSGYRSYADQTALLKRKIKEYGDEKLARRYNAEPGKSEHQTGLAVDLWDGVTWGLGVRKTKAGKWLWKHAREYGFILRYPPDKEKITGYAYEPWHFRYIGVEDSMKFKANSKMSLEEYLGLA